MIVGCEHITWEYFKSYLEMSTALCEIHFDSDILEFDGKEVEDEG